MKTRGAGGSNASSSSAKRSSIKKEKRPAQKKAADSGSASANAPSGGAPPLSVQHAVDPDTECPLAASTHVYVDEDDACWRAVLCRVEPNCGVNKAYVIELLESNATPREYYFCRKWGRVGGPGMAQALLGPMGKAEAIRSFETKFKGMTRNKWADRANFVNQPGGTYGPYDLLVAGAAADSS